MSTTENTSANTPRIIGGGTKKILYTLNTVRRIGFVKSAKALTSHNTCKACGLGMGGQQGGMTNELGEFPSVCNKSIQAQSTDIQPAIPEEIFQHPLGEFKKLSGREMETLGRLNTPLYKASDSQQLKPVSWEWALQYSAAQFAKTNPVRSFFYSSGRSSNEAGFILQLLARAYGTNNVNNCSYYCHQATGVGLSNSIGTGTSTIELEDLDDCDCVFVIGANPASNHPRLLHKLVACRERGGEVIVINPAKEPGLVKFAVPKSARSLLKGGSEVASLYLQPKIGSDVAVLTAIAKAVDELAGSDLDFIARYTQGYAEFVAQLREASWHHLETATAIERAEFIKLAQCYIAAQRVVFAWGMGITHHRNGVENVEAIANLALLRGMVGKRSAGLLPLRGHSNVQGIGTIGVKPVLADDVLHQMQQHFAIQLPSDPGLDTLACLEKSAAGEIDAALLMGGNLLEATPDTAWAESAFNRIPFKLYLTTTLNRGHVRGIDNGEAIILPVTARDEEWQPTTQESMFNYVRLSDGGISRLANARPEVEILCSLGKQLCGSSGIDFDAFKSHRNIREAIAATVPGMEQLASIDVAKREFHVGKRLLHTPVFNTPNGKARFIQVPWQTCSITSDAFPFTLSSVRSEGQFNSIIYEEHDSYRGAATRWRVLMNRDDMVELGIDAQSRVTLRSAVGEMRLLQVQAFDLPRGNLLAYYPEANCLIGRERDPRSKTPAFKSVAVAIEVVTPNVQ